MKKKLMSILLSCCCVAFVFGSAFSMVGCGKKAPTNTSNDVTEEGGNGNSEDDWTSNY